jgi:hypothetical protein
MITKLKKYPVLAIITVLIALPLSAYSQSDYLINLKGDTLKGDLRFTYGEQIDKVQITIAGKKTTYTGLQVRSIENEGALLRPIRYENSIRFMKVLKDGFLSYYSFNLNTAETWDGRYLSKKDGTGIEVPNLGFKKTMARYLSDCPGLKKQFDKGDFSRRDIERIIDLYNQCVESRQTTVSTVNEKEVAVKKLIAKVEKENFVTKKDALDALNDVQKKVSKNETIPNYLFEGLKSYLAESPSLSSDLESLITLLKK